MTDSAGNGRIVDDLRAGFAGDVIGPPDAGYDEARKVAAGFGWTSSRYGLVAEHQAEPGRGRAGARVSPGGGPWLAA